MTIKFEIEMLTLTKISRRYSGYDTIWIADADLCVVSEQILFVQLDRG